MKVSVLMPGGGSYSLSTSSNQPVAVVLTPTDKENITRMDPDATVYAAFPDDWDQTRINNWVEKLKAAAR